MRDHSYGAERDPSTVGTDATYIRQLRSGMFDDSFTVVGSDDGSVKDQGVKLESELDSRQASSSSGNNVQVFPNRLMPKPARKEPPPQRPISLLSREQRESRDISSPEMARDLTGVVATAMTEFDSTLRISPQIVEDLQSRSDEAMSQSGINHGLGISGRQKTESSLSYVAPHPSYPLHEAFCN